MFAPRQKLIYNKIFSFKHVSVLPLKYDVISQLRHSYAKGPFRMPQLINLHAK